jgi:hypothetical protein
MSCARSGWVGSLVQWSNVTLKTAILASAVRHADGSLTAAPAQRVGERPHEEVLRITGAREQNLALVGEAACNSCGERDIPYGRYLRDSGQSARGPRWQRWTKPA